MHLNENPSQKSGFVFLIAIPLMVTALAFILGHASNRIYTPLWLLNWLLMGVAAVLPCESYQPGNSEKAVNQRQRRTKKAINHIEYCPKSHNRFWLNAA